jgi:hypothetical protein
MIYQLSHEYRCAAGAYFVKPMNANIGEKDFEENYLSSSNLDLNLIN